MRIAYFLICWLTITSLTAQDTTRLSLLFAGDVMGHDSQIASAYNKATQQYDYAPCFQFVKPYVSAADLAIGNLELTLAGPPYKGYPQFSSPDVLATTLKDIGFDVLVTANNHSVDRRRSGIERTIKILDSLEIQHTGTFVDSLDRLNNYPLMLEKNGISLALLNYTYGTNGIPVPKPVIVNLIDTATIRKDLAAAQARNPDIVIVFMHWGGEYQNRQNATQKKLADFCFKHGADLVIGSHPHVVQPMEWHKEKNQLVVYSLGNYVSGQRKRYTNGGASAWVELQKIRYRPDSMVTTIDSAGYYLHWVYRTVDAHRDYYMCPVPTFERDTTNFIKDRTSLHQMDTFVTDARSLFKKYNQEVYEITQLPPDSIITYKVQLTMRSGETGQDSTQAIGNDIYSPVSAFVDTFYGYTLQTNEDNDMIISLGSFRTKAQAQALQEHLTKAGKEAQVVRYKNGQPVPEKPAVEEETIEGSGD